MSDNTNNADDFDLFWSIYGADIEAFEDRLASGYYPDQYFPAEW